MKEKEEIGSRESGDRITYTIFFDLRKNRVMPGKASIVDGNGEVKLGPWACLGCCDPTAAGAHGNPGGDPLKPWGHTPTGEYAIAGLLNHGSLEANLHSYGPWDTLMLVGVSGDAALATSGAPPIRSGIEAHAGDLDLHGHLRVTHGCLRSSNADQKSMIDFVKKAGFENFTVRVTES